MSSLFNKIFRYNRADKEPSPPAKAVDTPRCSTSTSRDDRAQRLNQPNHGTQRDVEAKLMKCEQICPLPETYEQMIDAGISN
ncbi:hypothetical protein ANO14919_102890 [Xylariales sp. No.14919]|nr:hypothetical protein ANO14919_102890 [Xylariales sp. No.14919]